MRSARVMRAHAERCRAHTAPCVTRTLCAVACHGALLRERLVATLSVPIATLSGPVATPTWPCRDTKWPNRVATSKLCRDTRSHVATPQQLPPSRHQKLYHKTMLRHQNLYRDTKICVVIDLSLQAAFVSRHQNA